MALFCVHALDKPGSAAARVALRDAHLGYVEANIDRYFVAGPLVDAAGTTVGSLLVIKAESEADARALMVADPYWGGQFWDRVEIHGFLGLAGTAVGGATWKS